MNKYLSKIVGAVASLALVIGVGVGIASNKNAKPLYASDFSETYNYANGPEGTRIWSLTNYTDQSSYYQVPTNATTSVATIPGIFNNKNILSDVSITINNATYGNGTSPSESTFSIYNDSTCSTVVTSTQSGTLASSSSYVNTIYTVSMANATGANGFSSDLAIKITKPGRTIRLRSIIVSFTYESAGGDPEPTEYSVTYNETNKTSGSAPTDANTYETGETVTVLGNTGSLVRTGYTWSGWSLNENGSGTAYGPAYTPTYTVESSNVNFYPIWVKNVVPLPTTGSFSITGTNPDFGNYGDDVAYTIEEDVTADTEFGIKCTNVTKATGGNVGNVQFKGSSGVLYSTTPLNYIRSVEVSGANSSDAVIKYGTSANSGCTSDSVGLRNTYFKISNGSSNARYWTITVTYSIVDPDVLTGLVIASGLGSVKKVYDDGEVFDPTGLVIQAEWNDVLDTEHNVLNSVSWSPNPLTAGTTSVTGTYAHATGNQTVEVTGLTVKAPDFTHTYASNSVYNQTTADSEHTRTFTPTSGPEYITLGGYNYSSGSSMSFTNVDGMYLGNNEEYSVASLKKFIRKIVVKTSSDYSSRLVMKEGTTVLPEGDTVTPNLSTDKKTITYLFNGDRAFFKLLKTGTSYVNITSIDIYLGSNVPVIDTVSASIKAGTYYAGTRLSASDFNVTVSWTEGKSDTHPTDGFTWTVNGVENGYLEEKSNNKVAVTYCGEDSAEFDVAGSPAPAKDIIESTLETQSSLTYHYSKDYHVTTDVINREFTTVPSGTNYVSWNSKTGTSGTVYAGNTAGKDGTVQLNNNGSNKGIIVTSSVGIVKSVSVVWNSDTDNARVVDIYGKNAAYASVADAFDTEENGAAGTLIGSITKGTNTSVVIDGSYSYIAIRSRSGAMYFESISIDWAVGSPSFSYSNVGVRFTGRIDAALWNTLNTQSTIEGYGIMYAETSQLAGSEIEEWYDLARASAANVDASFTAVAGKSYKMVNDSEVMCYYTAVPGEKEHPAQVGDEYVWSLFKSIDSSNPSTAEANLTKQYTAVAYIRTTSDEIIFLGQVTRSAADVALELYLTDASLDDALNGSLSDLANMA